MFWGSRSSGERTQCQPMICVKTRTHRVSCRTTEFAAELSEFSSEVNKRGRPSKWPPECLPSKFVDFECAFSLQFLGENMTPKDPFLEGTFWDKFWRPIRSRALLFTPDLSSETVLSKQYSARFLKEGPSPRSKLQRAAAKLLRSRGFVQSQSFQPCQG